MPDRIISACKKACVSRELPVFAADLQLYLQKMKQNPKPFSQLAPETQHAYLRYIYFENKLNELKNKDLVFSLYCHLLEKGSASLRKLVQTALDMQVSQDWNCRHVQALQMQENRADFLSKVCQPSTNFKPIKQDLNSSIESISTNESDSDDYEPTKRLEHNEKVFKVQNLLQRSGSKVETTGIMDPQTENNIKQYQAKNSMYADGVITPSLIQLLEGKMNNKNMNPKAPSGKVGGVALKTKVKPIKQIRGIRLSPKAETGLKFLVDSKQVGHISGVDLEDLALCLTVYADKTIKNKVISFSLDPWEEKNPEGQYQRKVLYPDILDKKRVIEGSRFSELMFECDYLMKQMSLGLLPDCKTPFKYPKELIDGGLKPISTIIEELQGDSQKKRQSWSRLWLVCNHIEGIIDKSATGGIFLSNDVKIEVHARQMEQDSQGRLIDKSVQDKSDPCYIFARQFSKLYPVICKFYPCFEEIKKLYRASALAKWIAMQGIAVDLDKIKEASQGQFLDAKKYENRVNSIRNQMQEDVGIIEKKIPVDARTVALRSLKSANIEATEANIKNAIAQVVKQNNGSSQFFDIQRSRQVAMRYVMGGVDMNCEIVQPKPLQSQQKVQQAVAGGSKMMMAKAKGGFGEYDEERKWDNDDALSSISTSLGSIDNENVREEDFPFALSQTCVACDKILNQKEMSYAVAGKYYCCVHHPQNCFYCGKIVQGMSVQMQGRADLYNTESFVGKTVVLHPECNVVFQGKCVDKANFDQQNAQIDKVNASCLAKVKEHLPQIKQLRDIALKSSGNFVCELCKKNNKNTNGVCCNLCGLVNSGQVNAYLKQAFQ